MIFCFSVPRNNAWSQQLLRDTYNGFNLHIFMGVLWDIFNNHQMNDNNEV